jgi:hypothetical protein
MTKIFNRRQKPENVRKKTKLFPLCGKRQKYFRRAVINNWAWASFVLWDNADRRYTQVLEMLDDAIRKDHPCVLAHHVEEFRVEKVLEFISGLMRTPWRWQHLFCHWSKGLL